MSNIEDFADQLHQSVVTDMAESYFGARKDLESTTAAFYSLVDDLKKTIPSLFQAIARLHALLLDSESKDDFYTALGMVPSDIPDCVVSPEPQGEQPFALTMRGRYIKCVRMAYEDLYCISEEYLNGRYYDNPEQPGRKLRTIHYLRIKALAEHINYRVQRINDDMSTTAILRHVKELDPVQMSKERIMGDVCLMEGCELDMDMCFTPIDFTHLELPEIVELPKPQKVKGCIVQWCKILYASRKEDIATAMSSLYLTD
ncbi:hypothetical protein PSDVSF_03460 [Pseudodesulfovibrio sediminis]|uniref:Uncharacterized protein n=1 Tax=Pseudodesulfovibrio sediminis TaxID=2810563 RepID=A0ABM9SDI6_9BACT|nr:hypothetical protein PSDVSF_03460 [Pseudodesulfovibrio sediminis]